MSASEILDRFKKFINKFVLTRTVLFGLHNKICGALLCLQSPIGSRMQYLKIIKRDYLDLYSDIWYLHLVLSVHT